MVSQLRNERLPLAMSEALKAHEQRARRVPPAAAGEREPGHDELDEVVEEDADRVRHVRRVVKGPRQRVGVRLGLEVVVEARQVAPARVVAQLDERRAEHHAEDQPAQKPDDDPRRRRAQGRDAGSRRGQRNTARNPVSRS